MPPMRINTETVKGHLRGDCGSSSPEFANAGKGGIWNGQGPRRRFNTNIENSRSAILLGAGAYH
jgi:hypothetical protein